jgi:flagellar motor switch protein FliN/FliY
MSKSDEALLRLGQSSSEAIVGVLEMFAPGQIHPGELSLVPEGGDPMADLAVPAVATNVSYVDGVTGGNVFVMTLEGARRLAAAMMGMSEPEESDADELSELELSAVSEAMNQMMASAAGAIGTVLGTEVEIGTPETRTFFDGAEATGAFGQSPHAIRASFHVCGEPCRLIQLVPNAFVVRMTTALDELSSQVTPDPAPSNDFVEAKLVEARPSLAGIPVRVWAELGRARMPSAELVGLPSGAVVELNRQADEPIDLYVNGRPFATGRLIVVDGTDWGVRIESILEPSNPTSENKTEEMAQWPVSW